MRCHLAYWTDISIYAMNSVSETVKPVLPDCWQKGKRIELLQSNWEWLSSWQGVHSLIQFVLKLYFHMSKIISSRILVVPRFVMSCHVKRNNKCSKIESGKWSYTHLHVRRECRRENGTHCNIPYQDTVNETSWNMKWGKGMIKNSMHSVMEVLKPK